ncbi:MAG: ATP-binding protein [Anaerolineae bacterium]|nr:ATP-binding protein [Anaerolineae bacterium]
MQDSVTRAIQAKTSPRILAELPRMFNGGLEAVFKEALQNAYRAGAQQVRMYCDHIRRTITISDDGCGIDDPAMLLHAGATGWDEEIVVEPAGLGIFSYLNSDLISQVNIRSGAFEVRIDDSVLQGATVPVKLRPQRAGTRICFELAAGHEISARGIQEQLETARAYYPFAVTLRQRGLDGAATRAQIPAETKKAQLTLDLPVGMVYWRKDACFSRGCVQPVWAHVPVEDALTVVHALERAAEAHPRLALAKAILRGGYFLWDIAAASDVRPKLPDRDAIQASPALDQAAQVIVNALVERFWQEASQASVTWPDRLMEGRRWDWFDHFERRYAPKTGDAVATLWFADCPPIMDAIFDALGWHEVVYADYGAALNILNTEDELSCRPQQVFFRDRTVPVIGSRDLAQTLNQFGHPVAYAKGAPVPTLRIEGLRVESQAEQRDVAERCDLALAERIEVEGFGELPALIPSSEWYLGWDVAQAELLAEIGMVFAGDLRQLIQTLKGEAWVENVLLWWAHNGDSDLNLGDYLDLGSEVQWSDFRRDVLTMAARVFEPKTLHEIEAHFELKAEVERVQGAICECERCLRRLEHMGHPARAEAALKQAKRSLQVADLALRKKANRLAQVLGLDAVPALHRA